MTLEELNIQLILAVYAEDLEKTKELIDKLNTMSLKIEDNYTLINSLSINQNANISYTNLLKNECIDYVINNLNNLPIAKQILFYRQRERILQETDEQEIEKYIEKYIEKENYEVEEKIILQTLIQLIPHLQNTEKISYYFSLVQNKFI